MFWADKTAEEAHEQLKDKGEVIVRDEKTASGRVHVGSMRGVAIHGIISDLLNEKGIPAKFLYEINDFDPMDGLPTYLDKSKYEQHMGKRLCEVPSPDGRAKSLAEFYADEFKGVIVEAGFSPKFYKTSELYTSGRMNEVIREALERAADIREIYKKVSGSIKPDDWLPLNVVCESCGKVGTTQVLGFDGEQVTYECRENLVAWAKGCNNKGTISPFDGNASLPWKVEWAAKFKVVGVDIEGAGKDHSTRGGARDVANHIARGIFNYDPPFDIPYEFFLVNGKKMSSSKGAGASAREIADSLPRKIFRLALLGTKPMRAINFEPKGNTIPVLYDRYDEIAEKYWSGVGDDDSRLYELVHLHNIPERHYRMRFSQVAFLAQMPHIDIFREAREEKGEELNELELRELHERIDYSLAWIKKHAPDRYVFQLQEDTPVALSFSGAQRKAFEKLYTYIEANEVLTGESLHHRLHEIKKEVAIEPEELFTGLYQVFLGRDSGPQAGWFLSVLPRDFLLRRLGSIVHTS
ncbi:lysine--tRNA ligase [bacterium]|nr:lysine--tRNA ligase [bacterium]|tara:strand:- start:879 stop:2447 length:1569 start_codon:yes stop_codon:yes gene_type:complete